MFTLLNDLHTAWTIQHFSYICSKYSPLQNDEMYLFLRQDGKNVKHKIPSLPIWAATPLPCALGTCLIH